MTEYQELIHALKHCAHASSCEGCPLEGLHKKSGLPGTCADAIKHRAAEALEELTTWRNPVNDPPAHFEPVLVCRVKDPKKPPVVEQGYRDLGGWWKVYGTRVKKIIGWRPMPAGITPPPPGGEVTRHEKHPGRPEQLSV